MLQCTKHYDSLLSDVPLQNLFIRFRCKMRNKAKPSLSVSYALLGFEQHLHQVVEKDWSKLFDLHIYFPFMYLLHHKCVIAGGLVMQRPIYLDLLQTICWYSRKAAPWFDDVPLCQTLVWCKTKHEWAVSQLQVVHKYFGVHCVNWLQSWIVSFILLASSTS